jgi:hypothetical protein
MKRVVLIVCILTVCSFGSAAFAEDTDQRLKKLEEKVQDQQQTIDALKKDVEKKGSQSETQATQTPSSPKASGLFGGSAFTNPNISLVLDAFYYSSNLKNEELKSRGIPAFTTNGLDRSNGFNLDSAELFIFSPVDPYSNLYVNLPVTADGIEIEEAYVVTTALPAGWQIKGGKFKSNFSRLDAQHPHAWDFFDIALPYRAFLGDEGLGGEKGVQLTYLPVLPIYTLVGVEVLQGENDLLFGAKAEEMPHAFTFFVKSSIDTSDYSTLYFGPSVLFGKTKNTNIVPSADPTLVAEFSGKSALYGLEAVWKWKLTSREALTIQSEYLLLTQSGEVTDPAAASVDSLRRQQDGFYVQGIYRKNRWGIGARYDMLDLLTDTFKRAGTQQNLGGKPWRETASLEYNPSEFTRIRLQASHDRSDPTGRTNDEAIVQFNFSVGAHPAHAF